MANTPEDQKEFLDSIKLDWEELIPELMPILTEVGEEAGKDFLISVGITQATDPDVWKTVLSQASDYARDRSAELVGKKVLKNGSVVNNPNAKWSITDTTRDRLHDIGAKTIDEGLTVNETQSLIMEDSAFSPARALNISRTERAFARGRGNHNAAKAAKMKRKSWLLGENPCDICEANAAQGWIPIDEEFESGDDCVPAHPSCRCSNAYDDGEDEGIDEEESDE